MKRALTIKDIRSYKATTYLLDGEGIDELKERLRRQRSPKVVIIDSLQYAELTYTDYKRLRDEFRSKLFIWISHAEGSNPKGKMAKSVKYDAFVKIYVEGYRAYPQSRFGGNQEYVIWEEGAKLYGLKHQ